MPSGIPFSFLRGLLRDSLLRVLISFLAVHRQLLVFSATTRHASSLHPPDRTLARIRVSREFFFCEREDSTCANWVLSVVQSPSSSFLQAPVSPGPPRRRTESEETSMSGRRAPENATGGRAQISYSRATGVARFVSVGADDAAAGADLMASGGAEARTKVFGVPQRVRRPLRPARRARARARTRRGRRHWRTAPPLLPVYIAACRSSGRPCGRTSTPPAALTAVNGTLIPDLDLNVTPSLGGDGRLRGSHPHRERRACRTPRR